MPPPKMAVNISSLDSLQLTVTKSSLNVLNILGNSFGEAYNQTEDSAITKDLNKNQGRKIKNDLGFDVQLVFEENQDQPVSYLKAGDCQPISSKAISGVHGVMGNKNKLYSLVKRKQDQKSESDDFKFILIVSWRLNFFL